MTGHTHLVSLMRYARTALDHALDDVAAGHYSNDELAHLAAGFEQLTHALRGHDQPTVIDGNAE
ncbi:hypothetical protein DFQ14_102150 [Halopolyspora algeriensis]|uniref:Uncharacterized protein n=1 Tax=Halopolyspora algeriensis TaxID=1500506 RepID=A0A368VVI2_9ACTN|nr:hypothetical protein [Halopolyspora algeriensis]RCW45849.1 hypothetical protein DFQ14_102150 [Halopolyspora algeriensis]TQM55264.1 hypothetical protein FHU43_0024 [Halopolyspora algeriensis]